MNHVKLSNAEEEGSKIVKAYQYINKETINR